MIDKTISHASIQSMLKTLRSYQSEASGLPGSEELSNAPPEAGKSNFGEFVSTAVKQVNQTQVQSNEMRAAYDRGENMPLTDVVLSMQKSSLAFEATLQVRNKVLKAYDDILNMPV
jgi:flagellar hook-basal body complex protein FliE